VLSVAQKTIVVKTCDVHGDDTPATDTVAFGIGSERFEIDACDGHASELRETLARYAGLGRRVQAGRAPAGSRTKPAPANGKYGFTVAELTSEERDFAVAQGWAGRGRVKDEIMRAIAEQRGVSVA
jgi:hypothetical protein